MIFNLCLEPDLPAADDHRSLVSTDVSGDGWNEWKVDGSREGDLEGCYGYNSRQDPFSVKTLNLY